MSNNKNIVQKCVRTYPNRWTGTTGDLNALLEQGYVVVMCHEVACSKTQMCLEYIVEKEVEERR